MSQLTRKDVLTRIASERALLEEYGVRSLSLFGSIARGEAGEESDVDLLVEFAHPIGIFRFVRLKRALETVLGRRVDLATPSSLKPQLRDRILKEAIRAA
ncbi:MAG: nucleotidyltransferase family protein [Vicinamibacteria bacterium]